MTDKEMLELAAKAAGYDINHRWNEERLLLNPPVIDLCILGISTGWNPLTDDGDALRLAVKLGILNMNNILNKYIIEEQRHHLRAAATRRAIVRAAAEIGKAMK